MSALPINGHVYFAGILSETQVINGKFGQQLMDYLIKLS